MEDSAQKKLWLRVKRRDIGDETNTELICVDIEEGQTGPEIRDTIMEACNLSHLSNVVLKLRNHRESLIPITWNIPANSSARPYLLEVQNIHQDIKAQPRSVTIKTVSNTYKDKLQNIMDRMEKLETAAPALKGKRNDKINKEMKEVEQMLEFLNRRLQDAENVKWEGMFRKNPLW